MATAKDIAAFRSRFVEFDDLPDAPIAAAINTADVIVDARMWVRDQDFALARLSLAAHLATLQQMQFANTTDGTGMSDLFVSSIKFGERNVSFQQRHLMAGSGARSPGEWMLQLTTHGQLYLLLMSRNIMPVVTVI